MPPAVIRLSTSADDAHWCATLMSSSDPWLTLGRTYAQCLSTVTLPDREVHLAVAEDGQRLGVVVLALHGAFVGYIQAIAVSATARGDGVGSRLLDAAEARIAQVSPNVFLCVSSFNTHARRLYERRGFQLVGTLTNYVTTGFDELLMRKSLGPWDTFTPASG